MVWRRGLQKNGGGCDPRRHHVYKISFPFTLHRNHFSVRFSEKVDTIEYFHAYCKEVPKTSFIKQGQARVLLMQKRK